MNRELIIKDMKRLPLMISGLILLSIGIHLVNEAYIGIAPWSVFHDGLGKYFNDSFGNMTIYVGIIILTLSIIFLKTKVGVGTLLNILIVGNLINIYEMYPLLSNDQLGYRIGIFVLGFLFTTFGRSLYIAADLGPGPRDGLFVGLARTTNVDVKYIKPLIEVIVIIIGFTLGGNFSVGTIILALFSGYTVEFFFKWLQFDPKKKTQSDITLYFKKENKKVEI